jgi:hypothetical protein
MTIKATTTNPATRFCAMAVTPAELPNNKTSVKRRRQRRDRAGASRREIAKQNRIIGETNFEFKLQGNLARVHAR